MVSNIQEVILMCDSARPALIMYVYKRLVSAVGIPQTWNQLGSLYRLSPLQQP